MFNMAFAAFSGPPGGFLMPQFAPVGPQQFHQPFLTLPQHQHVNHAAAGHLAPNGVVHAGQQLNFSNMSHVPAYVPGPAGFQPNPNLPFPAPPGMVPILIGPGGLSALPLHLRPPPGSPNLVPIAALQHLLGGGIGAGGAGMGRPQSMTQQLHLQHQAQHPAENVQQQAAQQQPQVAPLPPGLSDLDKLRRLQADIESGVHPIYKPVSAEEQEELRKRQEEMLKQREEMERLLEERARENGFLTEQAPLAPEAAAPEAPAGEAEAALRNGHSPPPMPPRVPTAAFKREEDEVDKKIRAATAPREPDGVDAMIGRATQRALEAMQRGDRPQGVNLALLGNDSRDRSGSGLPLPPSPPRVESPPRPLQSAESSRGGRYSPTGPPPPPPPPPNYHRVQGYGQQPPRDDRWRGRPDSPPPQRMARRRSPSPSFSEDRARKAGRFEPVERYGAPPGRGRDDYRAGPLRPEDRRDRDHMDPSIRRRSGGFGNVDDGHAQRRLRHSRSPSPRRGADPQPYGGRRFDRSALDDLEDEEQRQYEAEKRRYEEEKARYYRELEEYERKKAARAAEKRARQGSDAGPSPVAPPTPQPTHMLPQAPFQPDAQKHGAIASMWVPVRDNVDVDGTPIDGMANPLTISADHANAYAPGAAQQYQSTTPTSSRSRASESARASYERPGGHPPPPRYGR